MATPQIDTQSSWAWTQALMEPTMSEMERKLRDRFCDEYMKDGDAYAAASRVGFAAPFVPEMADRFMKESYVRKKLEELRQIVLDAEEKDSKKRAKDIVQRVLMDVAMNKFEKGSARVAACNGLTNIHGLAAPVKSQVDVNMRGGVLMVPAIADLNPWEQVAVESQRKLVSNVRD